MLKIRLKLPERQHLVAGKGERPDKLETRADNDVDQKSAAAALAETTFDHFPGGPVGRGAGEKCRRDTTGQSLRCPVVVNWRGRSGRNGVQGVGKLPPGTGQTRAIGVILSLVEKEWKIFQELTSAKSLSPRARVLYINQSINPAINQSNRELQVIQSTNQSTTCYQYALYQSSNQSIHLSVPCHFEFTQSINQSTDYHFEISFLSIK